MQLEDFERGFRNLCEAANRFMSPSLMDTYFEVLRPLTAEEWALVLWDVLHNPTPDPKERLPWPGTLLQIGLRIRETARTSRVEQRSPEQKAIDGAFAKQMVDRIRGMALAPPPPRRVRQLALPDVTSESRSR